MRKLAMFVTAAVVTTALPAALRAQDRDIIETATGASTFKTFTRLLAEAGLVETLKGPGPFTVFAPTDEAFAKVPAATLAALGKDKAALRNLLLYHLVAGKVMAADIAKLNGKGAKTIQGGEAKVVIMGEQLMIGNVHVVSADIGARNGVIHAVDAVLMPPAR